MALFHEIVQAAGSGTAAVANRVDLGDITLPAGDWVITRAWAHACTVGTWTASEGIQGYIQLESEDCSIEPCEFLLEPETAGIGTGGNSSGNAEPRKYIINCPAPGNTVIHCYHVCDSTISTATAEVTVTIEFARASPFPGGQIHMKCGEPGVAASTSDNGTASLTDIEIKASKLLAVATYSAVTTSVADTSVHLTIDITSSDFLERGPQRWSLNGQSGGEATNHPAGFVQTQLVEVDMAFTSPGQKQTVSAVVTSYDAVSTGPMCNWCLIYQ